jgi:hypothetical protein
MVLSVFVQASSMNSGDGTGSSGSFKDSPEEIEADPTPSNELGGKPNIGASPLAPPAPELVRIMLLRVYFNDYTATSLFTQADVQSLFDNELNQLYMDTSYGHIGIDAQVTALYQLPEDRDEYINDYSNGDLSQEHYDDVVLDAINNAPAGLSWTNLDAIMVLMAETDSTQFHRGEQLTFSVPQGPGGTSALTPTAIFSENPSEDPNERWGRWAHEIGHALQQDGPAHPSNYNNEFELMDSNYPGQTGVFEKQADMAFPGWLDPFKYIEFDPASGGGIANIWAEEYDPDMMPNVQAVRAKITDSLYYLISVRRQIRGDDLNGDFTPYGIPDEGVLIERVVEGGNPWVTVQGNGGNRNNLWHEGDVYTNAPDGFRVFINKSLDPQGDNYRVIIDYNKAAVQPDIAMEPWRSPPGNTWETTDIWIDSPLNGYDTYVAPMWADVDGNLVPRGNGDPPAVGLVNRVYARVRNIGSQIATDVVVHIDVTDPLGVGIAGSNGFVEIDSVDSTDFSNLASIPAGTYEDVYVEWTPEVDVSEVEMMDGLFNFHSCLRVRIDPTPGEYIFGNQDGDEEQENIDRFAYVPPEEGGLGSGFDAVMTLRNDNRLYDKFFRLVYDEDLPDNWTFEINGGVHEVLLAPNEVRDIPVQISPIGPSPPLGSEFSMEVKAVSQKILYNDMDPTDWHIENEVLGGVVFNTRVMRKTDLTATTTLEPDGVYVSGQLIISDYDLVYDPLNPFFVSLVGVDINQEFIPDAIVTVEVDSDGNFEGKLPLPDPRIEKVVVLFVGTEDMAPVGTEFLPLQTEVEATLRITPRTLNLKSKGRWVTARLTFNEDLAGMVDPLSLELEGIGSDRVKVLDDRTLQMKFSRKSLIALLSPGDVTVCVSGTLTDGRTFSACDTIRVIRPGK